MVKDIFAGPIRSIGTEKTTRLTRANSYFSPAMIFRSVFCLLLALGLAGCETPYKKSDKKKEEVARDSNKDTSFQAFTGRLKIAVANRDAQVLASMMAPNFGFRWDRPESAQTDPAEVFAYWTEQKLWPELTAVLQQGFVPNDTNMTAPAAAVRDAGYRGYRAGVRIYQGSWRFAYFLSAPPADEVLPPPVLQQ